MKRRKFLGFLGGAAVAGPSMAKAVAAQGIESLALPSIGFPGSAAGLVSYGGTVSTGEYNPLEDAKRDLARFLGTSAADMLRAKRQLHVGSLDPDLVIMRSLSLDAKIRIQRDRTFARQLEQERGWLEKRIADLLSTT